MPKTDKDKSLKSSLKNIKAQLKRRDDRIAKLEARIAHMEAEAKKKPRAMLWTKLSRVLQENTRTSVLRIRHQVRPLAQMRNKCKL
jgi:septal ring factor EnvC (AmiA/AmiB activator)